MEQIYARRLYKRAVYVGREQVRPGLLARYLSPGEKRTIATEIADAAGVLPHEVLLDIPDFPRAMSIHVVVRNRHRALGLEEISPLVTTLNETRRGQWRLGVYSPREHIPEVAAAAREILRIRPFTTQERLRILP